MPDSTRRLLSRLRVVSLLAALLIAAATPVLAQQGQQGAIWDLGTLVQGNTYPTTLSAFNESCRGKRDFKITIEGEATSFLTITGPDTLRRIARGKTKTTAALVDLRNVQPGTYNAGTVVVRCMNCPASCRQDYTVLQVRLKVIGPEVAASAPEGGLGPTRVRSPCLIDVSACDELLRRAQELSSAARRLQIEADSLRESQDWRDRMAASQEDFAGKTRKHVEAKRRQAREWRELADNAEADARINDRRAQQWPAGHHWRKDWEQEAARDRARAAERRKRATELDAEADRLEGEARGDIDEAKQQREAADRAQEAADKKAEEAEDAWERYEDCIAELRAECERQQREEARARDEAAAAAAAAHAAANQPTTPTPTGLMEPPAAAAVIRGYEPVRARTAKVCEWLRYNVSYGATATNILVRELRNLDEASAIEIRPMASGSRTTGRGFEYHCVKPGSAVITFRVIEEGIKKYRMRILCTAVE